jgi:5-oxoprolinase (ATP-hydrolysing)
VSGAYRTGRYRVGLDIGGTFTDLVLLDDDDGSLALHKVLTTPDDPATGALRGLRELLVGAGAGLADVGEILHGTTLVTNAIIERQGPSRSASSPRAGSATCWRWGTEQRYDIYDLFLRYPDPLVARRHRLEAPGADGAATGTPVVRARRGRR